MKLLHKKAVILLVAVLTVFLLAGSAMRGKYDFPLMDRILTTILSPVESGFSKVGYSFRQGTSFIGQMFSVYDDNKTLKQENEELRQQTLTTKEISVENARLRAMLDYRKGAPQFDFVTAAVIARDSTSWIGTITINRGEADGIQKDMPVVTPQGLVGNITKVYQDQAKVQLVLNPRSAVGGLVQRAESRVAAIIVGNGTNPLAPRMVNLSRDADIVKDDVIVTSGFGGIYPKGILIGQVIDVVNEEGGLLKYAVLKPAVDFDRLEEVSVIVRSREPIAQISVPPQQSVVPKGAGR